jgi:site-specific DNA-cytosine methylase
VADGVSRRLDEAGQHPGWSNGEPEGMQRVSVGIKDRANRLKALGNSIVPQVAEQIFRAILESERQP